MSLRSHVSTPDDRSILRRLLLVSTARRIKDFRNSRLKRIFRRTYYDRPTFGRSSPFSYCFASTCIIVDGRPYKSKIERNAANLNSTRLGANPFGRGNRNNEASGRTATSIRSEGYVLTNRGIAPRHIFIQSPFGGAPTPRVEMRRVHREETRTRLRVSRLFSALESSPRFTDYICIGGSLAALGERSTSSRSFNG